MSRYTITADGRPYTIDTEHGSLIVAGSHFTVSLETLRALGELAQRVMDDDVEPDRTARKADLMDRAMADVERQRRIALHRAATQALPAVEGHPPVHEDDEDDPADSTLSDWNRTMEQALAEVRRAQNGGRITSDGLHDWTDGLRLEHAAGTCATEQFWTAPDTCSTPDELAEWHAEMIRRTAAGLPNRSHGRRSLGKI